MSPRTEEQYEEIRHEKRVLIMNTALELFAMHGYENTTISQIAKKAGISKGLLYNYFESKEYLLEAILNKGMDEVLEIFDPNKDGVLETYEMEFFINEIFKTVEKNRVFWRLYMAISLQPSVFKLVEKRIEELYEPMMQLMLGYFKNAGSANPFMDAIIFNSLLDGITLDYILKPDIFPIEDIKKELIHRFCIHKKTVS
ncbi:MAG: TetR/AcrR family transcriptional regulator [Bacteroidales bacterium]|nr:TetR/AcrR family transcriptional regulator [Bacteroidales bacterium]